MSWWNPWLEVVVVAAVLMGVEYLMRGRGGGTGGGGWVMVEVLVEGGGSG